MPRRAHYALDNCSTAPAFSNADAAPHLELADANDLAIAVTASALRCSLRAVPLAAHITRSEWS